MGLGLRRWFGTARPGGAEGERLGAASGLVRSCASAGRANFGTKAQPGVTVERSVGRRLGQTVGLGLLGSAW